MTRYFSSVCRYVGLPQYTVTKHYDRSFPSMTWESQGSRRSFQRSKKQNILTQSSSHHPQTCSSPPTSYSPLPQITQARTAAGLESLSTLTGYSCALILPAESHTFPYHLYSTESSHHCFSRLHRPKLLYPQSHLFPTHSPRAPILYPAPKLVPPIGVAACFSNCTHTVPMTQ